MIISTKELIENKDKLNYIIEKERALINSTLANQEKLKSILLNYLQKLADSTESIDASYADNILTILDDIKNSFNLFNTNIALLNKLLKQVDDITVEFENKDNVANMIENFNTSFLTDNQTISQNTLQIENVLYSILPYSNLIFSKTGTIQPNEDINTDIPVQNSSSTNDTMKNVINIETSSLVENTLIISETKGKVFLPYTIKLLNNTLENNPNKYTSIEDVIDKDYTLPIDLFKNPALARFREGFKLIRKKEKRSIVEAFDLGMELTFNYNLYPAIICACKNLADLDLYLDYLYNKENEKFDCFKIIFDVPPVSS